MSEHSACLTLCNKTINKFYHPRVDIVTSRILPETSFALKTISKTVLRDAEHRRHSMAGKMQN